MEPTPVFIQMSCWTDPNFKFCSGHEGPKKKTDSDNSSAVDESEVADDYGDDGDGNSFYEVEKITGKRSSRDGHEYKVHWKNYKKATWTPAANCEGARLAIAAYENSQIL